MMTVHPDSVEMWGAYSTVLMGASAIQYGQKRRGDRLENAPEPPSGPTTKVVASGDVTVKA